MKKIVVYLDPALTQRKLTVDVECEAIFNNVHGVVRIWTFSKPKFKMIEVVFCPTIFNTELSVKIFGGAKEIKEWETLTYSPDCEVKFTSDLFARAITPAIWNDLVCNALELGQKEGISRTQKAVRKVLGM